eukprot:TRINITY_DN121941_c0_g1_i1.p1 TRINITY_DN121941_c0_g1~~TRINITY_DN121941_c0_g1_i1.p1  ORF type:complete len:1257 (+),score=182.95 TRINITY_DN121941_c0_g1_i1:100-3870(+)
MAHAGWPTKRRLWVQVVYIGLLFRHVVYGAAAGGGSSMFRAEPRVIVRYTDAVASSTEGTLFHAQGLKVFQGVRNVEALKHIGMAVVSLDSEDDLQTFMEAVASDPAVAVAVPDSLVTVNPRPSPTDSEASDDISAPMLPPVKDVPTPTPTAMSNHTNRRVVPNDPLFPRLWGLDQGTGEDIDGPEAWSIFSGHRTNDVIVAIIDSGIDYKHEDLRDQMWRNTAEIPDNGVDDDGNGFVDDLYGVNFITGSGDPMDDNEHGTHCAGTIAAMGNNSIGTTGVAWTGVKLMALKFLDHEGSGRSTDAVKAIDYAIRHGARILSNSWGGESSSSAVRVAVERAQAAGILFIAAAGNSGTDNDVIPQYPANYGISNLISVASTERGGDMSFFSCYGASSVHVAAPGSDIWSTVPFSKYKRLSGTSMACPYVTGLAALLWMRCPQLSAMQVRSFILDSVVKTAALEGRVSTGGQINAFKSLQSAKDSVSYPPINHPRNISFDDEDGALGAISGQVVILAADNERDIEYYKVYVVTAEKAHLGVLGSISPTGEAELHMAILGSYPLPPFAAGLEVVAGNATGETFSNNPYTPLKDYVVPAFGATQLRWLGDCDPHPGFMAGTLEFHRAEDEATLTGYQVYWRTYIGEKGYGPLLDTVPTLGYRAPSCSLGSCANINIESLHGGGYRCTHLNYTDIEEALITLTGPGHIVVTYFDTEDGYDFLRLTGVDGTDIVFTGNPKVPKTIGLPAGEISIQWHSDLSIASGGWTFEVYQKEAMVQWVLPWGSAVSGQQLELVPIYLNSAEPTKTASIPIIDYNEWMPPSEAFKPGAMRVKLTKDPSGNFGGVAVVQPAEGVARGTVTHFLVQFANDDEEPIGEGWQVPVNGNLGDCLFQGGLPSDEWAEHSDCWVTVPLVGLAIGEEAPAGQPCVAVCSKDMCIGSWLNALPFGSTWEISGKMPYGCCAFPFPGWGECHLCCQPQQPEATRVGVPPNATKLIARAGNQYGIGIGQVSLDFDVDTLIGEAKKNANSMQSSMALRGAGPDTAAVQPMHAANPNMHANAEMANVIPESTIILDSRLPKTTAPALERQDPWEERLKDDTRSQDGGMNQDGPLGKVLATVSVVSLDSLPADFPSKLQRAVAATLGDAEQVGLRVNFLQITRGTGDRSKDGNVYDVSMTISPSSQSTGATSKLLDAVEAKLMLLSLNGQAARYFERLLRKGLFRGHASSGGEAEPSAALAVKFSGPKLVIPPATPNGATAADINV